MFARLKELRGFLRDGMTVETSDTGRLVMRTMVQLDGDLITFVAPPAADEAVRTRHWALVDAKLKVVTDRLNGTARVPTWWLAGVYFAWRLWELAPVGDDTAWIRVFYDVAVSLAIATAGMVSPIRRLVWRLVVWAMRSRLG